MKAMLENPASIEECHHDSQAQMRVLLRHKKTGRFFCATDRWTANPALATDFHTGWWATAIAVSMDAENLAVVYAFDDQRYNINIPILGPGQARDFGKKRSLV
ncbi:MAG TPA: hypothetical protein VH619_16655 [Verrucomicrobiae bacterium]|nr:hypothetical protein [Verrucomicrobiae bacterium]